MRRAGGAAHMPCKKMVLPHKIARSLATHLHQSCPCLCWTARPRNQNTKSMLTASSPASVASSALTWRTAFYYVIHSKRALRRPPIEAALLAMSSLTASESGDET